MATVFSAFVGKDAKSDRVQISRNTAGNALTIFVNSVEETSWFTSAAVGNELSKYLNVGITKESANKANMAFSSG